MRCKREHSVKVGSATTTAANTLQLEGKQDVAEAALVAPTVKLICVPPKEMEATSPFDLPANADAKSTVNVSVAAAPKLVIADTAPENAVSR